MILFAVLALAGVYFVQYSMHVLPCKLCYYQRVPYIMIIVASLAALLIKKNIRFWLMTVISLLAVNLGISGFHVGVEKNWINYAYSCTSELPKTDSLDEFKNAILNKDIINCDIPNFFVLGQTLAFWNFLALLTVLCFSIYFYKTHAKSN
jgi:disulfide bond formation protein DsbB